MWKEELEDRRESFRVKIRLESKNERIRKFREELMQEVDRNRALQQQPFDKERVFIQCMEENNAAFLQLGNELLEREGANMLLAEAFGRVRRYSECEHYSWVILVITFKMVGILQDYAPFLQVFLPIIDRCCDPKSVDSQSTIQNGLKALKILTPLARRSVVNLTNFPCIVREYVFDEQNSRTSSLSIGILRQVLDKDKSFREVYAKLMELGVLETLSAILEKSVKEEEDFFEGLAYICEEPQYCEAVLLNKTLLNVLMVRHSVGSEKTKSSIYHLWRTVLSNCSVGHILQLVELGVLEVLIEGVKCEHSVQAVDTSLAALKQLLDHMSVNCMSESDYLTIIKRLDEERLPEIALGVMSQYSEQTELCESILSAHFDSSRS